MKNNLDELRKEIDALDDQIISLLAQRIAVVKKVGATKKINNIAPLDEKRWQEVLNKLRTKAKTLNLSEDLVEKIYNSIHEFALKLEKNI